MRMILPGGTAAYYEDHPAKSPEEGPTVILVHGANVSLRSFDAWVAMLKGKVRLIAVDLPGHGLTGPTVEADYSPAGMSGFLSSFVQALDLHHPPVLVGHSLGGHLCWRLAIERPVRLEGLVLISSGGLEEPRGPQRLAARIASWPLGRVTLRLLSSRSGYERGLRKTFFNGSLVTPEFATEVWRASRRKGVHTATVSRLQSPTVNTALAARVSEIGIPTLLMWGKGDTVFSSEVGRSLSAAIPGAELIEYDNCGHFPMMELPADTANDFELFLKRL